MKNTKLHITILGLALLFPFSAIAAAQLSATDSIAGLGMTVTVQNMTPTSATTVVITNPQNKDTILPVQSDATGKAIINVSGKITQVAGTYTVHMQDKTNATTSTSVAVLPETLDPAVSTLQSWTPHIRADGSDSADIRVTLRDKYGNILPGRPVALVSSNAHDLITALTPETGADGVQHFSLTAETAGTSHIRAVDLLSGNTLASSADIQVGTTPAIGGDAPVVSSVDPKSGRRFYAQVSGDNFDIVDGFEITAPTSLPVGEEAQKVVIRAIDKNGNTVENYVGTVTFESTDPSATLPNFGSYTFKDRDLGQKSFALVLTFKTPGQQIFRVKDQSDDSITGSATIAVGGDGTTNTRGITITSYKNGDSVSTTQIIISGKGPAYANLTVMGGTDDASGTSDGDGNFSIPITLSSEQHDFTIRVQDDTKQNDSGPLHLVLDTDGPKIGTITFSPEAPSANEKVLAVVQADAGLPGMNLRIEDADTNTNISVPLTETLSGSYQGFFDAPAGGMYQPAITATDTAGNSTEVRTTFTVGMESLPTVQNVKIEPRVNSVALEWDALSDSVSGYRVYVGESADNFLYTLETGRVTTKATVAGLVPGKTYYFAVTAMKNDIESKDKSAVVHAEPLGLTLTITPGDGTLHVQWTSFTTELPLSSFQLEYGTEGAYTETRVLNGGLRDFMIRDLLNGVLYNVRLLPVTITGEKLEDLAAKGDGTPSGSGFHAAPNDPVPGNLGNTPGNVHPAPSNPGSGLPTSVWMATLAIGLIGAAYGWYYQKKRRHTAAFLQSIQSQYYR